MQDVIIIGGGLAGLVSSIELARAGHRVTVIERKTYPFHRVCGEYVSNEVRPYLESLGLDLTALGAVPITQFRLTAPAGRTLTAPLDLGAFGISRYRLDFALYELAQSIGVTFSLNQQADNVSFTNDHFAVATGKGQPQTARLVIGAFGKRSRLDKSLGRAFMEKPSPYIGVKYHIRSRPESGGFRADEIALHNFQDGYCGMSMIEDGLFCLCYLTTRANLRQFGNIPDMERAVLHRNPHLRRVFESAEFVWEKPEVINEISFAPKPAVENHILMAGDAAGLITPLCGNGMAMAIHGGKIAADLSGQFLTNQLSRMELEKRYQRAWSQQFGQRLWVGRTVQKLFGNEQITDAAVGFFGAFRPLLTGVIRQTHGQLVQ
jgi:menaquinone-9 beta-reductase